MNMERYKRKNRKGAALLVVLFVIMTIVVLSFGFLSKSDVELSCGVNMILRTQMDYLAESGLEHAKGLITGDPNNYSQNDWVASGQQLTAGSDYYDIDVDVLVAPDPCDPNEASNYSITSTAYRNKDGDRVGESVLTAELLVDPLEGEFFRSIQRP